jgi:diguanylate cyclase (GGDEF)-like protein/PAS domain S-box-containing protein
MQKTRHKRHPLRKRAEAQLAQTPPVSFAESSSAELLHELQVHQIQLEMQNENLHRAQTLLAESHARYVELYNFSPVAYLTLTSEGMISQINPMGAELLGQSRERLLKRHLKYFFLPECHEQIDQLVVNAVQQSERHVVELTLKRFDGSELNAEWIYRCMTQPNGHEVVHVAMTDIGVRKHAELQLRIAATAFESQEGMLVMDRAQVILQVNGAFGQITGYTAEDAVGRKMSLLNSERHDAAFYTSMWEAAARVGAWQGEVWSRRKNGEIFPEWLTITAVRGDDGAITRYVATLTDNTLRKAEEEKIKHLAFYDSLTQLPNRQLLLNRLQQALAASIRSGREGALLFIDLDNFKALNDTLGHSMGDLLLQQVAQRLNTCIREGDTVARLGGDEFVVMLEDLSANVQEAADQIEAVGEKILSTLNVNYVLDGHDYHSTPSIGATLFHEHKDSVTELLKSADLAMYHAKSAGRNALRFFDPNMQAAVNARINLEAEMREGLQTCHFVLHYQAQVDEDGHLAGAEALLRWQHPVRGLLAPAEFLSLAEDSGLIVPIGEWVFEAACRQLLVWSEFPEMAHLNLSVNLSPREIRHPDFVNNVLSTLKRCGADPRKVCFEFAESLLGRDLEETVAKMNALKSVGIRFALDNFGYGISSLSYLKSLPLDQLKIGKPFVRNLLVDPTDAAIAKSIVLLGESLGLDIVAEGLESVMQFDFLDRAGCRIYQGFLFGHPGPAEALREVQLH